MAEIPPNRPHSRKYVYIISLIAAAGGFNWGFDIILMSGAILYIKSHFHIAAMSLEFLGIHISSAWIEGFTMTSAMYGTVIGMMVGGPLADRMGRKRTLVVAAILLIISAVMTTIPKTLLIWNIFRLVGGIGAGLGSLVSPVYISEIAPAEKRGALVTINQFAVVLGAFAANVSTYAIAKYLGADPECWRWMFASGAVPITAFLVGIFFIPESPRWLVMKNRIDEARAVLARVGGTNHADSTTQEIQKSLGQDQAKVRFWELFRPGIRTATIISCTLAALDQFVGVPTLIYYAPTLFVKAGISSSADAIGNTVLLRVGDLIWIGIVVASIDRFGRRPLLLLGTLCIAVGQLLMGACFYVAAAPIFILIALFFVEGTFNLSLPPVTWLISTEIFPTRYRARGMALHGFIRLGSSLFLAQIFPPAVHFFQTRFGSEAGVFWVYAAISLLGFGFCYYFAPETKGKTLEEISGKYAIPK